MASERFENSIGQDLLLSNNRSFGGLCLSCHDLRLRAKSCGNNNITRDGSEIYSAPYSLPTS